VTDVYRFSIVLGSLVLAGCGGGNPGREYLAGGPGARRALEDSLVDRANTYSAMRLAHYATGRNGDWKGLPASNPSVEPIAAVELDGLGGASSTVLRDRAQPLEIPNVDTADQPTLRELGRQAFARYPTQLAPYMRTALGSRAAASRAGLWVDATAGVGGLVRARMADGSVVLALTCATCHTARGGDGRLVPGLPNAALDIGRAVLEAEGIPAAWARDARAAWGPGRVDVSTTTGTEPARIPDLRPVRWLTHLHQDATLRGSDLVTLAIRIETLVITASNQTIRPPRLIALALAAYIRSLADDLPPVDLAAAASPRGAALFARTCADCHTPPGFTGQPVSLAAIGTDATLGLSRDRGTGSYRVPSLRGVGTRGPLLHDGTVPSVGALLDPTRPTPAFSQRLHGHGPVRGHTYGLSLPEPDRRDLVAYLQNL